MSIDSKKIAQNTVFLYFRFLLILGVTLYVSRVLLSKLGVEDYGLYNAVVSVIGMISFITHTLSSGTSRFITFELGKSEESKLKITFTTALYAHIIWAVAILIIGETVGLWYVHNKLVVPPDRVFAARIVYQVSVLLTFFSIMRVPFMSTIVAHEKMNAYAYIGIYEAFIRFGAAYAISFFDGDKLINYSILLFIALLSVSIIYVLYSRFHFEEARFSIRHDNRILVDILKFSGWNILANLSNTLSKQGVILLFNLFFTPIVVAAQAIGNQVSRGLAMLVQNVRAAVNPQVIKLYADGSRKESEKLTLLSSEFVFYLLMIVGFPMIMVMPTLLDLWLEEVPDYAVIFARFLVLEMILENFNNAYYYPMLAANKISLNSILEVAICALQFVILYLLFKMGLGPVWARYVGLVVIVLFSFVEKPLLLWKIVGYDIKSLYNTISRCFMTMTVAVVLNIGLYLIMPQDTLIHCLYVCIISAVVVTIPCMLFLPKEHKNMLKRLISRKHH